MVLCGSRRCSIKPSEYLEELSTDLSPLNPMSFAELSSAAASKLRKEFEMSVSAMMVKGLKVSKKVGYM